MMAQPDHTIRKPLFPVRAVRVFRGYSFSVGLL